MATQRIMPTTDTSFNAPNVVPIYSEGAPAAPQGPATPATGNAAATGINTDYTFNWQLSANNAQQVNVRHVILQNNTAAIVNYDIDAATTLGSLSLAAGATIVLDIEMTTLHLRTAAAQQVNGSAAANIVVRAWF